MLTSTKKLQSAEAKIAELNSQIEKFKQSELEYQKQIKLLQLKTEVKKHATTKGNYRFAFEIQGEQFFTFTELAYLSTARDIYVRSFIQATGLVIDIKEQKKLLTKAFEMLVKGDVDNTKLVLHEISRRLETLPLPKLIFRMMAQVYFKQDDDLSLDLPPHEIERRAQLFERSKKKVLEEIFMPPISTILKTKELLQTDSEEAKGSLIQNIIAQEWVVNYLYNQTMAI